MTPVPNQAGAGQRLEHGLPDQAAAGKEEKVLEGVDARVVQGSVVEERDVPEVEIDRPDRKRDERMREHAERLDPLDREDGPQDRPGQPGDKAQRREVADDHVLEHVHEEEVLLAQRVDRRVERQHDKRDPRSRS